MEEQVIVSHIPSACLYIKMPPGTFVSSGIEEGGKEVAF